MEGTLQRKNRDTLRLAALLILDIDDLKHSNDSYGHAFGAS